MHPVKRAILKDKLRRQLRDQRIQLYLMADGEPCRDLCYVVGALLATIGHAYEESPGRDQSLPEKRVLTGGLSALAQMAKSNRWLKLNTVAVVQALDAAERMNGMVSNHAITKAWNELNRNAM